MSFCGESPPWDPPGGPDHPLFGHLQLHGVHPLFRTPATHISKSTHQPPLVLVSKIQYQHQRCCTSVIADSIKWARVWEDILDFLSKGDHWHQSWQQSNVLWGMQHYPYYHDIPCNIFVLIFLKSECIKTITDSTDLINCQNGQQSSRGGEARN